MSKIVVIYKALPNKFLEIVQLLENHNLHPEVVDNSSKTGSYRRDYIRIAVPVSERDIAVKIISEAENNNEKQLLPVVKSTNKIILTIIVLLGIAAIVGIFDQGNFWFIVTWLLITLFAGIALIRWAWSSKSESKIK